MTFKVCILRIIFSVIIFLVPPFIFSSLIIKSLKFSSHPVVTPEIFKLDKSTIPVETFQNFPINVDSRVDQRIEDMIDKKNRSSDFLNISIGLIRFNFFIQNNYSFRLREYYTDLDHTKREGIFPSTFLMRTSNGDIFLERGQREYFLSSKKLEDIQDVVSSTFRMAISSSSLGFQNKTNTRLHWPNYTEPELVGELNFMVKPDNFSYLFIYITITSLWIAFVFLFKNSIWSLIVKGPREFFIKDL